MSDEPRMPRTAGELRRSLAERNASWVVDPRLGDDDPLPDHARGGQPLDEGVDAPPLPEVEGDLNPVLQQHLPTNPFLRARWVEAGLLGTDDPAVAPGEPVPESEPDSG